MKEPRRPRLLAIDSIINVVLGVCLRAVPGPTIAFFGPKGIKGSDSLILSDPLPVIKESDPLIQFWVW